MDKTIPDKNVVTTPIEVPKTKIVNAAFFISANTEPRTPIEKNLLWVSHVN